jgi:hypothetical protein
MWIRFYLALLEMLCLDNISLNNKSVAFSQRKQVIYKCKTPLLLDLQRDGIMLLLKTLNTLVLMIYLMDKMDN